MRKGVKASRREGKREGRRETKGKKRKKGKERKDSFHLCNSFVIPKQPLTIKISIYSLKLQSVVNNENR